LNPGRWDNIAMDGPTHRSKCEKCEAASCDEREARCDNAHRTPRLGTPPPARARMGLKPT